MSNQKIKCQRCFKKGFSLFIKFPETQEQEIKLDICPACAAQGMGYLLKLMPEQKRHMWINQFMSGIIS